MKTIISKTYLYVAISIFCWSTVATVSKLLLGSLNSIQVLWASSFYAFTFLLIFNIATGNIEKLKVYKAKDYCMSILISSPSTVFYYLFYYTGTDLMLASQAFIVNYLWPIMSVVFACIVLKEKVTWRRVLAVLISFAGVVISSKSAFLHLDKTILLGTLFCLLGAMSYGLFTSLNQKYSYDNWLTMMVGYLFSFLLTSAVNAVNGALYIPNLGQCLGFAWNGAATMAIANVCWVLALRSGNTAKVSNFAYITPFLSLVWTAVFLKEKIEICSIIGLLVIVLGIFVQLKDKNK